MKFIIDEDYQNDIPYFPKVKRVIWLVRHGERLDNDKEVKERAKKDGCINDENSGREFSLDNSPLNQRGMERAAALNNVFNNIDIQHLFASPYERAIQTAVKLLGDSHKNYSESRILTSQLKIKVEPGFIETMSCVDEHIGYEKIKELRKHHPRLDVTYTPIFNKKLLAKNYKVEEGGNSDMGCCRRIKDALNGLIENLENEKYLKDSTFFNSSLLSQINEGTYKNHWIQPGEETAGIIILFFQPARSAHWIECAKGAFNTEPRKGYFQSGS
uniref:Uncharacterized protein n=1 Tax=Meloidogyne enterolobii TaxID=390850 RepID=A0A6V7UDA9_MELEN|nr:unnamed protein product [Meloidogyne enterolobii]